MAFGSNAQPMGLCSGYDSLVKESMNKFAGITGKELSPVNGNQRMSSTLELKDASSCYIVGSV